VTLRTPYDQTRLYMRYEVKDLLIMLGAIAAFAISYMGNINIEGIVPGIPKCIEAFAIPAGIIVPVLAFSEIYARIGS